MHLTRTGHSVDSMSPPRNFTARAARWSASHRKTAVLSWLAFVVVAFALGNAAGTVTLKSQDQGNGESRAANQVLAQQFPRERAGEVVLIQSGERLGGAAYRAIVADLIARLSRIRAVTDVKSPLAASNAGLVSKDGRSALLTFLIKGDPDTAQDRVGAGPGGDRRGAAAHPQFSCRRVRGRQREQGDQRAHQLRFPAGGDHVAAGHPDHPRDRVRRAGRRRHPAAAGDDRGRSDAGADRGVQPRDARGPVDQLA